MLTMFGAIYIYIPIYILSVYIFNTKTISIYIYVCGLHCVSDVSIHETLRMDLYMVRHNPIIAV